MNSNKTKIPDELLTQFNTLLMIVSEKSQIKVDQILGKSRKMEIVESRRAFISIAMQYCRFTKSELHKNPYQQRPAFAHLGKFLGNRNHSSIHNLYGKDGEIANHCLKYDRKFDRLHTAIEVEITKGYNARHAYEV